MVRKTAEATVEAASVEEYASVTVTIDHLVLSARDDGHTVVKDVWSTESAVESLLAQLDYFGDTALLRSPQTRDMIAQGNKNASIFVYTVGEAQTNVIVDAALWSDTVDREGSVLGAHASLIALATDMKRSAQAVGKGDERVLAFVSE